MLDTKRLATGFALGALLAGLLPGTVAGAGQRPGTELGSPASITKTLNITPHDLHLIEAGLAIVVLLAIVLVLRIRRRRRADRVTRPRADTHTFPSTNEAWRGSGLVEDSTSRLPAFQAGELLRPTIPPGWHPLQGDPSKLRYWDGSRWTAQLEWDGRQWVDAEVARV